MISKRPLLVSALLVLLPLTNTFAVEQQTGKSDRTAQVPDWSTKDMDFFLHGSMSTELIPEKALRAFIRIYPDLFPTADLSGFGLIPDPKFGWPIGFSRGKVTHLGGLPAVGVNCAACHAGEITSAQGVPALRVLGMTSHFDPDAFFGAVIVSTFRTSDPEHIKAFLSAWLDDSTQNSKAVEAFAAAWQKQQEKIAAVIKADPFGAKGIDAGKLYAIKEDELRFDAGSIAGGADLSKIVQATAKLFHNMRAAVHVPDEPPRTPPLQSGPGRNDAFGLLSAVLLHAPQPYAPVKFGLVWNVEKRPWVHWDGNTQSPLGRNILAALGLGAPLIGKHGLFDFALVKQQTDLSEKIHPPRYPFAIDEAAAKRGAEHYKANCASCHDGPETDARLHAASEIGTDPLRAESFNQLQADRFNKFLAELETPGYKPSKVPGLRSTQKYWAASLAGVWARSPYLHNGSVRTMQELLTLPANRAQSFHRGSHAYDMAQMGYEDGGTYVFDTTGTGNSNAGHDYGTKLSADEKHDLIEYLKTL